MSRTGNEVDTNFRVCSFDEVSQNMGIQDFAPSEFVCREVSNSNRNAFDGDKVEDRGEVATKYKRPKLLNSWSSLWVHFDKVDYSEENIQKVRCKYCREEFEVGSIKHGTNDFIYHCYVCKKKPHDVATSEMLFNMQKSFQGTGDDVRAWRALCTTVIGDEIPFEYVERAGFRHLVSVVCPQFSIPSRKSLAQGVFQIYIDEKLKLKSLLKESSQRVCISTETWRSVQNMNYMCLSVHFIDNNWELQKRVLNFCPITSQQGEEIGKVVTKCIREWGLENIFTITIDDVYSSDDVVSCLKKMMDVWKTSILSNQYVRIRCISSLINQGVLDILKEFDDSVDCIREAIKYVKSTPVRYEAFSEFAEFESEETNELLCIDVPNRWDSTYLMLESATRLKNAFYSFGKSDENFKKEFERVSLAGAPSRENWEIAQSLVKFMGHLYDISRKISGSSYATSNNAFHEVSALDLLIKECHEGDDIWLRIMMEDMKTYLDKYLGSVEERNKILYYAVIVDPRYKLEFLEYCFDKMYDAVTSEKMKKEVKEGMTSLFDEYKRTYDNVECCSNVVSSTSSSSSIAAKLSDHKFGERHKPSLMQEFKKIKRGCIGEYVKSELDRYLAEKVETESEDNDNFNILVWWKVNVHRFPILSKIARDVLAVPLCNVTSDATYNMTLRVLDAYKRSLLPKTVEALVCVLDWLREFVMPVCIKEDIHEPDWLERELSKLGVASSASILFD